MSDIYCGVGKLPKGKKYGSMKQCAEQGQIRRYGLFKVDKRTIEAAQSSRKKSASESELLEELVVIRARIKKLIKKIKKEKDQKTKDNLKDDARKLYARMDVLKKKLKALK